LKVSGSNFFFKSIVFKTGSVFRNRVVEDEVSYSDGAVEPRYICEDNIKKKYDGMEWIYWLRIRYCGGFLTTQ
jgi:hypothetical protein